MLADKFNKVNKQNTEKYVWGDNCEGWYFFKHDDLSIIRELMPPGTSEKLHYHKKSLQFFFLLAGEATFEVEGEKILLLPGEGITISPGLKHCIKNNNKTDLDFLVISHPESHDDRINVK
ncbi:MAG: cupin domain-containing protein [Ignavibacteriaceae bacterium]